MHDQNHIVWNLTFHYEKSKQKYNFESNLIKKYSIIFNNYFMTYRQIYNIPKI
jgi:hypothetical protein